MVGLSRDEAGLDQLVTTTPHIARLVDQYLNKFPKASKSSARTERYQLSGEIVLRSRANALKIRDSIKQHCESNAFDVNTPLKSLVLSALMSEEAKQDILCSAENVRKCFEEFVYQRLMSMFGQPVWDKMKKLQLDVLLFLPHRQQLSSSNVPAKQIARADAVAPKMVCLAPLCVNATAETARIRE